MSTSLLPTDDQAVLARLAHFLDTQRVDEMNQKPMTHWRSPEGWRETTVNHIQRAKAFLVLEEREDLLDEWLETRFRKAMDAWIPHLPTPRLPGEFQPKVTDERAAMADMVMAAWREQLGPQAWVKALMTQAGRDPSPLTLLLTRPCGLDWALQALKDGATTPHTWAFGTAIHRGREDVVTALLAAGTDPNGSPRVTRAADLPLAMPVKKEVVDAPAVQRRIREALVAAGADVNRLTGSDSLLHHMALQGRAEEVRWLLDQGANPHNSWTHGDQTYSTLSVLRTHQGSLPQAEAIVTALEQAQASSPTPEAPTRRRRAP